MIGLIEKLRDKIQQERRIHNEQTGLIIKLKNDKIDELRIALAKAIELAQVEERDHGFIWLDEMDELKRILKQYE